MHLYMETVRHFMETWDRLLCQTTMNTQEVSVVKTSESAKAVIDHQVDWVFKNSSTYHQTD